MKNPNHNTTLGDVSVIYPNLNDLDAGIEPAIVIKSYYDGISVIQGAQTLYLPKSVINDFCKALKVHEKLNHKWP